MYVLEIERDGACLVQGFVRAQWPSSGDLRGGLAQAWIRLFVRSAALWSQVALKSAGLRIALVPGSPVTTVHSFVVEKCEEARLRLLLAAFLRTEGMGTGRAEVPQRGMALDGTFLHPGEPRMALVRETLAATGNLVIHHNLLLADLLPQLLPALAGLAIPFAYEFQAIPWSVPREPLRAALVNAARLADEGNTPRDLVNDQIGLAERARKASFHVEECLAAPRPDSEAAIYDTFANVLAATLYAPFGAAPRIEPVGEANSDAFAHHVHSSLVLDAPLEQGIACVTAAATRDDVDRCLSCRTLGLTGEMAAAGGAPEPLALELSMAQSPGTGAPQSGPTPCPSGGGSTLSAPQAPSLFVSYARVDNSLVYPMVESLGHDGVSLWIDRRLIGGDDWLAELEQQLTLCRGVLAFVSPAFAASRYCCREVRFADALSKAIIPVVLAPASLTGGLSFVLHAIQQIYCSHVADTSAIMSAIRQHAPETIRPR